MKIVGYKRVSFKASDGSQIDGYSLFVTEPFKEGTKDCGGISTDKLFVRTEIFENLCKEYAKKNLTPVNQNIQVFYNRYGKPEQIIPR